MREVCSNNFWKQTFENAVYIFKKLLWFIYLFIYLIIYLFIYLYLISFIYLLMLFIFILMFYLYKIIFFFSFFISSDHWILNPVSSFALMELIRRRFESSDISYRQRFPWVFDALYLKAPKHLVGLTSKNNRHVAKAQKTGDCIPLCHKVPAWIVEDMF